jgi:hypothetical protein
VRCDAQRNNNTKNNAHALHSTHRTTTQQQKNNDANTLHFQLTENGERVVDQDQDELGAEREEDEKSKQGGDAVAVEVLDHVPAVVCGNRLVVL